MVAFDLSRLFVAWAVVAPLCATCLSALTVGGAATAQTPQQAQKAELHLRESRVLTEAWVYLELANANYDGHRAKAMRELEAAVRGLNKSLQKNGTARQKAIATADDIAAAKVKFLREHAPGVINPQALSDLYLRQAGTILLQLRPALVQLNQPKVLKQVDAAAREIMAALRVR
jgi:hypothetical protein